MSITEKLIERVNQLPPRQREEVLDFVEFLHQRGARNQTETLPADLHDSAEHIAIGEAGVKLAAEAWPREDFSDWPGYVKQEPKQ